jgi:S-adenosylmethionine-diacylglycerol 3-amino-3-carboxypropyl transferase
VKASELDTGKIWYSASNEDTRSEVAALNPAGKSLLCITASGSRTFDLLIHAPSRIISIDQNPAQTAFAELLAASYRQLDYTRFAAFVGLSPGTDRSQCLKSLLPGLPPDAQRFWARNAKRIDDGLIYCGKWEGYLRTIQQLSGKRRRRIADRLLAANSLTTQSALWADEWDDRAWRRSLHLLSVRWLWTYVFREPGMQFVPQDFDIEGYARARFQHAASHDLFARSPFAWLLMKGAYASDVLPPYLTEAGFDAVRGNLDRVTFVTASLQETLRTCDAGAFDGASLSDYASYCDVDVQRGVWNDLSRAMATGGRVCERKFFNKSGTDLPCEHGFDRDLALEAKLFNDDHAFFYSFVIAEKR